MILQSFFYDFREAKSQNTFSENIAASKRADCEKSIHAHACTQDSWKGGQPPGEEANLALERAER